MEGSVNVTNAVLDKKMDCYNWQAQDYVAEQELTVTITLAEYRKLITELATKRYDIDRANEDRFKRENENAALAKECEELRMKLYRVQAYNVREVDEC